ncbi:cyclin-dependent kinase 11A-like [Thunnus thynnus]|uniref:cyclin-dependent kinase 11A-like n=1 Tax=Thunnus thynnus TaxID=8237 RepID=UPI0035273742
MERKRTRLRLFSEEEDRDRRSSQRFRKRVRYFGDDEDEDEENEQPGPSTRKTHNQRTQENRLLHVTCGNKKGILDVRKLDRGKECIKCEGRWFAPPAFEDFGGKGHSKKWKTSIFHDNKPLQFWFEKGSLTTKGFKRRRTETAKHKKILSSDHESGSLSEESEISLQSAEDTVEDDVEDEDWHPSSEELAPVTEEEERVGTEKGGEVVEEEDKLEKGEMEDEDIPADADSDSDNHVFEVFLVKCRSENSGHTDVATCGQYAAQLQEMAQEKRCTQTVQASDLLEGPSSGPSAGFNLDTMDLDQLKREKIKMQLKVLKLQEEYYTLQIKKFKQ